jgi:hypothetical protein
MNKIVKLGWVFLKKNSHLINKLLNLMTFYLIKPINFNAEIDIFIRYLIHFREHSHMTSDVLGYF